MSVARKFLWNSNGTTAVMFALGLPIIIVGVGVATDYSLAMRERERLNSYADAAALSAVSASGMQQTDDQVTTVAQNLWRAEATNTPNVSYDQNQPSVTITHPSGAANRTVQISYTATFTPTFANLLHVGSLTLSGNATAVSAISPNTDYYVLLDNSNSMSIAATQDGITKLQGLTTAMNSPVGCAFACHMANPHWSAPAGTAAQMGMPCVTGTSGSNCPRMDPYALAHANNITLRFDELVTAMGALVTKAQNLQAQFPVPPTYRFEVDTLDGATNANTTSLMSLTANFASQWPTASPNLVITEEYDWSGDDACATSGTNPCGAGVTMINGNNYVDNGYMASKLTGSLQAMANKIPVAGSGTSGSSPAEVLFLVTDGVEDYVVNGGLNISPLSSAGQAACTTLKNNGVKVAILYTTYYPIPGFWVYDQYVAPIINNIAPALQSCASPGLFMTANVGDDISAELQTLFDIASGTSKLTQ